MLQGCERVSTTTFHGNSEIEKSKSQSYEKLDGQFWHLHKIKAHKFIRGCEATKDVKGSMC